MRRITKESERQWIGSGGGNVPGEKDISTEMVEKAAKERRVKHRYILDPTDVLL